MSVTVAKLALARSVRIAETLVESVHEAHLAVPHDTIRRAEEAARLALDAVRAAARDINEAGT